MLKYNTPLPLVALDKISLFILGIGIGDVDSIYCGVSQHSWEAGLKRAGRYGIAIVAGNIVDKWLEEKRW